MSCYFRERIVLTCSTLTPDTYVVIVLITFVASLVMSIDLENVTEGPFEMGWRCVASVSEKYRYVRFCLRYCRWLFPLLQSVRVGAHRSA